MKIEGRYGNWFDEVLVDGHPLPLAPSLAVANHSPDGFAWGYGGSGPAQLALAILLAADIKRDRAVMLYPRFCVQFIAPLPRAEFSIEIDVSAWAAQVDGI